MYIFVDVFSALYVLKNTIKVVGTFLLLNCQIIVIHLYLYKL